MSGSRESEGGRTAETGRGWGGAVWVPVAGAVLLLVAVAIVVPALRRLPPTVGDGSNVDSYGFDLRNLQVDRKQLRAAGVPKDGIPALESPAMLPGVEIELFNAENRGYYLTSDDRVIGVTVDGRSRAYPIHVLNWHEVVLDSPAGVPIAVTYHPLCDSVAVFDRRVGGEVLQFGVSGLLYASNHLLFDRRENPADESLWSQLQARAVSGPAAAAGRRLRALPFSLARWADWLAEHPDTEVIRPTYEMLERYQQDPFGSYLMGSTPRFPVAPLPPRNTPSLMTRVRVVETAEGRAIYPLADGIAHGEGATVFHAAWFAWYAQHASTAARELVE